MDILVSTPYPPQIQKKMAEEFKEILNSVNQRAGKKTKGKKKRTNKTKKLKK
jgi:hypothetical protein